MWSCVNWHARMPRLVFALSLTGQLPGMVFSQRHRVDVMPPCGREMVNAVRLRAGLPVVTPHRHGEGAGVHPVATCCQTMNTRRILSRPPAPWHHARLCALRTMIVAAARHPRREGPGAADCADTPPALSRALGYTVPGSAWGSPTMALPYPALPATSFLAGLADASPGRI